MPRRSQRDQGLFAVAKELDDFKQAAHVLRRVRSVPTIFPIVDHAFGVGGLPIDRFGLVHGPSSEGKTTFTLGLILSFIILEHFARLIDAERTTPITWCEGLMAKLAHSPLFGALRPTTYEEVEAKVRRDSHKRKKLLDEGRLPANTSCLYIVDSIRKLTPANMFQKIALDAAGKAQRGGGKLGSDGMGGRGAQIKANYNAAWCDELTPLLDDTGAGMIWIARETKDNDGNETATKMSYTDQGVKVGGGAAPYYDASYVARVEKDAWVYEKKLTKEEREAGAKSPIVGERFRVTIRKTKVTGKKEKVTMGFFHTANGNLEGVPEGFDRPRDVLELALKFEVVRQGGSWFSWDKTRLGNGENNVLRRLHAEPDLCQRLEAACRERFANVAPEVEAEDAEA